MGELTIRPSLSSRIYRLSVLLKMNYKLLVTYALYIFVILSMVIAFAYPIWATAKGVEIPTIKSPEESFEEQVERLAKEYQVDKTLALSIMRCESNLRPEAINVNKNKTIDYSYWQINNYYWEDYMLERGWDIKNPNDNLEAGFYLLSVSGTAPWIWSKPCWSAIL